MQKLGWKYWQYVVALFAWGAAFLIMPWYLGIPTIIVSSLKLTEAFTRAALWRIQREKELEEILRD